MKYDDDRLIDNAACASQLHALMDEETTRQAVKDNVCAPLRVEIAAEKQRADNEHANFSLLSERCLGRTHQGHPRHPLYVPKSQGMVPFGAQAQGGAS